MTSHCQRAGLGRILEGNCSLGEWEALAQGVQRSYGCPWIPGSVQGHEQSILVAGVPAMGSEPDDLEGPFQLTPFYDRC